MKEDLIIHCFNIGPESYKFFNLKPFAGFETTSDSASYFLAGVYLEDNIGTLFTGRFIKLYFYTKFWRRLLR